jgi:hypothetical protein
LQEGEEGLHRGVVDAPTRPIDPVMALFFNTRTKAFERNCEPLSELSRIQLNSDYAEDDVKPRNRADAACSQGTGLTFSA